MGRDRYYRPRPDYIASREGLLCSRCKANPIGGGHASYCVDCQRDKQYQRKYGISLATYRKLYEDQSGLCGICGTKEDSLSSTRSVRLLSVDHNHATGKTRGLLCHRCNISLGNLEQFLSEALVYLAKYGGS